MQLMARTLGGKALVSRMELSIIMWPLHWTSNRYTSGFLFLGLLSCMIDHLDYLNFCSVLLSYMKTCPVSPIIFCCLYGYDWPIHCNIMCQITNCYFIYIFMKSCTFICEAEVLGGQWFLYLEEPLNPGCVVSILALEPSLLMAETILYLWFWPYICKSIQCAFLFQIGELKLFIKIRE